MYRTQNLSYTPNLSPELEAAYALISGALAEPVSGIYGLAHLPFTDAAAAAQAVEDAQSALTYQPSEAGQAALTDFGEAVMSVPVIGGALEMMAEAPGNVGDYVYDQTGSPLLGALAAGGTAAGFEVGLPVGAAKTLTGRLDDIHTPRIFAGVNAKTADLPALDAAKRMEARGATRDEIWRETGWFNDRGDWKFEIGDEDFSYDREYLLEKDSPQGVYMAGEAGRAVDHPDLFGAYPRLEETKIVDYPWYRKTLGQYSEANEVLGTPETVTISRGPSKPSTLMHELQHAIQQREGFQRGGSPTTVMRDVLGEQGASIQKQLDDMDAGIIPFDYARYRQLMAEKDAIQALPPYEAYSRLAGEAEARNVQTRLDWTPEQRRETPPWQSLDVPEDELIYRR